MTRGLVVLALGLALIGATPRHLRAADAVATGYADSLQMESAYGETDPMIEVAHVAPGLVPAVAVTVTRTQAGLVVEGRSRLRALPETAWAVLTDYDGIKGFVSTIKESRVTGRSGDHVLVRQAAVGRVFLFSRRMTTHLRVQEQPFRLIRFEDVLGRDFESYRGEWRIEEHGDQVEIVYRLTAKPKFPLPDMVARGAFRREVRSLIAQVGIEIERRSMLAGRRATGRG